MTEKRRGLGRGLSALIPTTDSTTGADRPRDVFFGEADGARGGTNETRRQPQGDAAPAGAGSTTERGDAPSAGGSPHGDLPSAPRLTAVTTSSAFSRGGLAGQSQGQKSASSQDGGSVPSVVDVPHRATEAVSRETDAPAPGPDLVDVPGVRVADLRLDDVTPNAKQPRTQFDEDDLAELADSIRLIGVLQPIVVRPLPEATETGARFELVMGERRWRASRLAGQETVPAIIRTTDDDAMLRDALLENLHRAQLNPVEEAAAYQQLLTDFGCTHEELAGRIGRSRPQITNTIRLLRLPPLVSRRVAAGVISAGHARALLALDDPAAIERLAQRIVAEGLSVRTVEELVALGETGHEQRGRSSSRRTPSPELEDLAATLSDRFDTRVKIAMGARRGRLTVEFASVDDLNRILNTMGADPAHPVS